MKIVRTFAAVALMAALQIVPTMQAQRTYTTYLTGVGNASESDRSQALSEATEQANNGASSPCVGNVTQVSTVSQNCTPIGFGDNVTYMCMVTVRATCQLQTNGR